MTSEQPKDSSTERRSAFGRKLDADPVLKDRCDTVVWQLREEARKDLEDLERSTQFTAEDFAVTIVPCPIDADSSETRASLSPEMKAYLLQRAAELCEQLNQALQDPTSPESVRIRELEEQTLANVAQMLADVEASTHITHEDLRIYINT